jgi:phage FluMu gp28-like protein
VSVVLAPDSEQNRINWHRPWLYPRQLDAIYDPARVSVVEASTKSGKTSGCLVWLIELAMRGRSGQNYWWVAPSYSQTSIAYVRAKHGLSRDLYVANKTEMTITLINGTVITFKTAEKPDLLYGEDVYGVVLDESTRMREEAWYAIRTTITATQAPVRIIGNVKGRKNWAYRMARRAEKGEPDMAYHKLTSADAIAAGILAGTEVEGARRDLPEAVFRELYEAEPSDDEGNPFGLAHIAACTVDGLSLGDPVAWGWDLARAQDYTVGIAFDFEGDVCRFVRFQKPWEETLDIIVEQTGGVRALVDATGVGDPIVERLQKIGWNFERFVFTSSTKQQLMERLALAIQHHAIRFPRGPISIELEGFEYEYTRLGVRYSAPSGDHDDCVIALALAVSGLPRVHVTPLATLNPARQMLGPTAMSQ